MQTVAEGECVTEPTPCVEIRDSKAWRKGCLGIHGQIWIDSLMILTAVLVILVWLIISQVSA